MTSLNFCNANLRGRSFKGQDFTDADFSGADIRGTNFAHATLVRANFSQAKAGLQRRQAIALLALTLTLIFLAGFLLGYAGGIVSSLLATGNQTNPYALHSGIVALASLCIFAAITLRKSLAASGTTTIAIAVIAALIAAIATPDISAIAIFQTLSLSTAVAGVMVSALATALIFNLYGRKVVLLSIPIAVLSIVLGALFGIAGTDADAVQLLVLSCVITGAIALPLLALGGYTGWAAWHGNHRYALIRSLSLKLTTQGTCFRASNLTDADFTEATLKHTDFRSANLTRTCWWRSQHLDQAQLERTYLEDAAIRQLVISKNGQAQNFDYQNLRPLNLQDANLMDVSLIGADLSEATLQNADLSRAKLTQTQLYRANLTNACLTGAYIQDWGISTDTQLQGVTCEYIYMRLPTTADPDPCRKPDNRQESFQPGDFSDFIAPILTTLELYRRQNVDPRTITPTFKTLDLFHPQGIDPTAAAIALQRLAESHPEAQIQVVALEGRGQEKIRVQAQVAGTVDRSQLSAEYFAQYGEIEALSAPDLQTLLAGIAAKDARIHHLEQLVASAIGKPKFYVETHYSLGQTASKKILILTANPKNTDKLRLDQEVREIQHGLDRAKQRDRFEIISRWATRPDDLRRALLDHNPNIVHFSGHGGGEHGLALENDTGKLQLVSTASLTRLFSVFRDTIECVLLNACYSEAQASAISQHIPYVIGMNQAIGDRAAIEFSVGFYDALGAGRSIEEAFEMGCASIELESIPESLTPVMKRKAAL